MGGCIYHFCSICTYVDVAQQRYHTRKIRSRPRSRPWFQTPRPYHGTRTCGSSARSHSCRINRTNGLTPKCRHRKKYKQPSRFPKPAMKLFSRWFRFFTGKSEKPTVPYRPPTPPLRRRASIHGLQHYHRCAFEQPRVPPYSLADLMLAEDEGRAVRWWDDCEGSCCRPARKRRPFSWENSVERTALWGTDLPAPAALPALRSLHRTSFAGAPLPPQV